MQAAGGHVHWARDAAEANAAVAAVATEHGASEVVKVKSITTDETKLNDALAAEGIAAVETDLAELIVQLDGDSPSHILVPAIHRNRAEIRDLFRRELGVEDLSDEPAELTAVAREHLRRKFLEAKVGVSGANFGIAETGTRLRGRVRGQRADVHHAARRAGDRHGRGEGAAALARPGGLPPAPAALLDRRADEPVHLPVERGAGGRRAAGVPPRAARQRAHRRAGRRRRPPGAALHSLLRLPERVPGLLARRRPRLRVGLSRADRGDPRSPAGSAGGPPVAAVRVVAVRRLRRRVPGEDRHPRGAGAPARRGGGAQGHRRGVLAMRALARVFGDRKRYERAQSLARAGRSPLGRGLAKRLPGPLAAWTSSRELPTVPEQTFREWWKLASLSAREDILERARAALVDRPDAPAAPAAPRPASPPDPVGLFCDRVSDYRATVHRCAAEEVARYVRDSARERLAAPADAPPEWGELIHDHGLSPQELDALDGVVTGCELAIAETGTIVLRSGGAAQGRRALTLVPDLHVCVVGEHQVHGSVPEAIAALRGARA